MEEEKIVAPFEVEQENVANIETVEQKNESSENTQAPQPSAESVTAPVEYAGFWVRFAAFFVDVIVLFIPLFTIQLIFYVIFADSLDTYLQYVVVWIYAIYMLNTRQATLGKMMVGIKVTSINQNKSPLGKLILRETICKFLNLMTLGIGYLLITFTTKKQGLHDLIADTVVVYDSSRKRRDWFVSLIKIITIIISTMLLIGAIINR